PTRNVYRLHVSDGAGDATGLLVCFAPILHLRCGLGLAGNIPGTLSHAVHGLNPTLSGACQPALVTKVTRSRTAMRTSYTGNLRSHIIGSLATCDWKDHPQSTSWPHRRRASL